MTFDAAVDITGTPELELDFDGTAKGATCATGMNTTTMACSYTVGVGDSAPNGVGIAANTLIGSTIYATGSTTISAALDHTAVLIDADHKVDGIRPTLVTTGTDAPTTSANGASVLLVFSEDIGAVSHSDITIQANSVTVATSAASVVGTKVEITLTTALTASATNLTVALAADAVDDAAGNGNLARASDHRDQRLRPHPAGPAGGPLGVLGRRQHHQPVGDLDGADEHRSHHRHLRPAVPGRHQRDLHRRPPERDRHQRDDHGPDREHPLPGAGAGHQ